MKKKILVVAAHPDDEVLGCGGSIARHIQEKDEVRIVIFGEGPTARLKRKTDRKNNAMNESQAALKILGVKRVDFLGYKDQLFEEIPQLEFARRIESTLRIYKADRVYTHCPRDLNLDHRRVAEAVMVACRPVPGASVKQIFFWETLSSTEWIPPGDTFKPNLFIDISGTLTKKRKALQAYKSEIRKFPHPRSLEGVEAQARFRGVQSGVMAAESFEVARIVI